MAKTAPTVPTDPVEAAEAEHESAQQNVRDAVAATRAARAHERHLNDLVRGDGIDLPATTPRERARAALDIESARRAATESELDEEVARDRVVETLNALTIAKDAQKVAAASACAAQLEAKLLSAQEDADALALLLDEHSILKYGGLGFSPVQSSTPLWEAPLTLWRRSAREHGLLSAD